MKRIELDGFKSWVWERAGAASFRYLADIAREEERSLDDLVLLGASRHPALPELLAQLGEDPRERHDDWSEYFRRYRALGLRALWSD
ncbi:MAG: hypothetical protein HUU30_09755, partial [Burkholderiaceae bacterium]|nr:hypothetical protein [Burkholderiaceae bacterium]